MQLPYTYNVHNATTLANNLTKLKITPKHRCVTLGVRDLYVKILIKETVNIVNQHLKNVNMDKQAMAQNINILEAILHNNYFMHDNKYYTNKKGVAMGSPLSGTMAEVFLQHYEELYVKHLLEEQAIKYYARYVDDILIVFDSSKITISEIQKQTESIHKKSSHSWYIVRY